MFKIIPLGGMTVTKNLFVYETDQEILLVDCGIGFPDETMLGVDLLIPDTTYLEESKKKIVGMLLTHGHDDHIAGLPYILPKLPEFPIFASRLTAGFATERMREYGVERTINIIDDERGVRLGDFAIESIKVTHSVPDARHFLITTSYGNIYHGSDFKFDLAPIDGVRTEFQKIASAGKRGIDILLSDCLRSEKPGFSASESTLSESFESEIRSTKGKVIITVMSSNVHRMQQAVDIAARLRRRVALFGRSVEVNARIAQELGFLKLPTKAMLRKKKIRNVPDNKLALIVAGSQGQEGSALVRAAREEHSEIKVNPKDKIIFSADPIPGNERAVYETIDALAHLGAEVVYHDVNDELHVSGHASSGELMFLIELIKPKYLVPIGGTYRHMVQYRKLASKIGYQEDDVFLLEEGQTLELNLPKEVRKGKAIPLKNVMVDGLGIGDVGKIVLRDRQLMAEEGMLVVIVPMDGHTGQIVGDVEVISRGVVFMKESKELIDKAKHEVYEAVRSFKPPLTEWRGVKEKITNNLEKLFSKELERFPLIIPIIIRT
jgi:ribonuclease J